MNMYYYILKRVAIIVIWGIKVMCTQKIIFAVKNAECIDLKACSVCIRRLAGLKKFTLIHSPEVPIFKKKKCLN